MLKLVILGHFLPFYPPKKPQNQNFEKWKNLLEISSFYTCAPKITIIWCTVPEIRSETDRIFCHFGPFFPLLPPSTPTPSPLIIPKIKILKKMKKTPENIIILQMCTKNDSHMMYGSWHMECNGQNFGPFFCPFTTLRTQKIKILK